MAMLLGLSAIGTRWTRTGSTKTKVDYFLRSGGSLKWGPSLFKRDMDSLFLPDGPRQNDPVLSEIVYFWAIGPLFWAIGPV